jgi:predicted nucleotidyltransferase
MYNEGIKIGKECHKMDIEQLKLDIIKRLKPLDPQKVVLFGSYAYGTPNEDSDIDLYVVTKDEFIPKSFKEKSEISLRFSKKLRDLQKEIPIDLIVHTKEMYKNFVELNSSFYKHSILKGEELC